MHADLGKSYFELFGIPARFEIDGDDLMSRYRDLQRRFHPDRFAAAPESERLQAVQMTAQINAAYQTLRDDVSRGRYLLGLKGVSTDEETDTRMNPEFLMEQMELREELEEIGHRPDRAAAAQDLLDRVDGLVEVRLADLRGLFKVDSDESLRQARATVRELQFLHKLAGEIDALD